MQLGPYFGTRGDTEIWTEYYSTSGNITKFFSAIMVYGYVKDALFFLWRGAEILKGRVAMMSITYFKMISKNIYIIR